jgi:hypothetical protein
MLNTSEEKQAIKELRNALTNTALFKISISTTTTTNFPDLGSRYEFLELLGQGDMGTVYRVKDKALKSTGRCKRIALQFLFQTLI